MTRLTGVLQKARQLVIPTQSEEARIDLLAKSLLKKTKQAAGKFPETRGVLLGGSFAKGTWVLDHVDIDIFVRIDPSVSEDRFERIGLEVGTLATRGYPRGKKFAQHPYTEAEVDGVRVNIVPCYAVKKGEWKSAADRSPFHVKIVEGLSQEKKAHVRLLKAFMNAVGVYGAEIQTQGFSGYVAEVLVMEFGSFEAALEWFSEFRRKTEERVFSLPDPIDETRDLGIAVSGESLGRMVLASREFLRRPDLAYFHKMSGRVHSSLKDEIVAVVFSHRRLSEDTLWGELRKTTRHVVRHLEVQGFLVARSMAASNNKDKSAILLLPEFAQLPAMEHRVGPTVDRRKDVQAFLASNAKESRLVWVDGEARVSILRPRRYVDLNALLKDVTRGRAGPVGASRELEAGMKKTATVLKGATLTRSAASMRWLQDGIKEITSDAIGTR